MVSACEMAPALPAGCIGIALQPAMPCQSARTITAAAIMAGTAKIVSINHAAADAPWAPRLGGGLARRQGIVHHDAAMARATTAHTPRLTEIAPSAITNTDPWTKPNAKEKQSPTKRQKRAAATPGLPGSSRGSGWRRRGWRRAGPSLAGISRSTPDHWPGPTVVRTPAGPMLSMAPLVPSPRDGPVFARLRRRPGIRLIRLCKPEIRPY